MGNRLNDSYNSINIPKNIFKIDYIFMDKLIRTMRVFMGITFILAMLTIVLILIDSSISNRIDFLLKM